MTTSASRTYLTREAALRAILYRMAVEPSYRPSGYAPGQAGLDQAADYLEDVAEALCDHQTEGDS